MNIQKDLQARLFTQREEQISHLAYNSEFGFYRAVASGDLAQVKTFLLDVNDENTFNKNGYGKLSDNRTQNARYHFVVAAALITRFCTESGMDREVAYTLSDLFIHSMDKLTTFHQILQLYNKMILQFTEQMARYHHTDVYSIQVVKAMEYISANLHRKLTTEDVGHALSVNRSYLSALFKKETGGSLHAYILSEKIKACGQMLLTTDLSYAEISEYYGFSSQSHFTRCFREETGLTPAQYRKNNYQHTLHSTEIPL